MAIDIDLSKDQKSALDDLMDWWKNPSKQQLITLGGYAGCGKTTIISLFREMLYNESPALRVCFCAFTGKASSVMKHKLTSNLKSDILKLDFVGTIHSVMYVPEIDDTTKEITGWHKVPKIAAELIIIDEASMVSKQMYSDLASYNIPIIAIGDHGQLPPIDSARFNLMDDPMIKLETLHRFAEKDGLIKASMMARIDGHIPFGKLNDQVFKIGPKDPLIGRFIRERMGNFDDSIILCGFNKTRIKMNRLVRNKVFNNIDDDLVLHDKVVCLKNNRTAEGCAIYNGMIGEVIHKTSYSGAYDVKIRFPDERYPYKGVISKEFCSEKPDYGKFIVYKDLKMLRKAKGVADYLAVGSLIKTDMQKIYLDNFDYGYCITVHKSQGSEWGNVMVLEEKSPYWSEPDMWRRWLYTAVTRARDRLVIVSSEKH